jgi:hypothetical protein
MFEEIREIFKEIEDEIVGYLIKEDNSTIEKLIFGDFIGVHAVVGRKDYFEGRTYPIKEIYDNLRRELASYRIDANNIADKNIPKSLMDIANEALDRESIINAMNLIKTHYLINR